MRTVHDLLRYVLDNYAYFSKKRRDIGGKKAIEKLMDQVKASEDYIDGMRSLFMRLRTQLVARKKIITALTKQITILVKEGAHISGDSRGDFETHAAGYMSADLGFAYAPRLRQVLPYFGVNIYLRPVDKSIPLKRKGGFGRRFSLLLGVTLKSLAVDYQRDDLFGSSALMFGAGYRITDSLKLSAGGLLFKGLDPIPIISKEHFTTSYFISISLDWDVKSSLGSFSDAIF